MIDSKMLGSWLVEGLFTIISLAVQGKHLDEGFPSQMGHYVGIYKKASQRIIFMAIMLITIEYRISPTRSSYLKCKQNNMA